MGSNPTVRKLKFYLIREHSSIGRVHVLHTWGYRFESDCFQERSIKCCLYIYDGITQLVEWWNHNPYVTSSSLVTIIFYSEYSAVGSAPALGAGSRKFESYYSENNVLKYLTQN